MGTATTVDFERMAHANSAYAPGQAPPRGAGIAHRPREERERAHREKAGEHILASRNPRYGFHVRGMRCEDRRRHCGDPPVLRLRAATKHRQEGDDKPPHRCARQAVQEQVMDPEARGVEPEEGEIQPVGEVPKREVLDWIGPGREEPPPLCEGSLLQHLVLRDVVLIVDGEETAAHRRHIGEKRREHHGRATDLGPARWPARCRLRREPARHVTGPRGTPVGCGPCRDT